jgi:hypothetical protein
MGILDLHSSWKPSREYLQEQLKLPQRKRLKLESFPRGLDGARIDVWLGEPLNRAIADLVQASLVKRMQMLQIGGSHALDAHDVSDSFREVYGAASLAAAQRARAAMRREVYQLFHLAVVKQILLSLDWQLQSWLEERENALDTGGISGSDLQSHLEQVRQFRRCRSRMRFLVAHEVLEIVHSLDRVARKRRKSILAISWPVAEEMLFNPLLQLGTLDCEETFLELYPAVLQDAEKFRRVDKVVLSQLREWLPECCVDTPSPMDPEELKSLPLRQDKGELDGYAQVEAYLRRAGSAKEYQKGRMSWLDHPPNLVRLFGGEGKGGATGPWRDPRWSAFQEELIMQIARDLSQEGLLEPLLASMRLRNIYPDLGRRGSPALLIDYLLGNRSRQEVISTLDRLEEIPNLPAYQSHLARARKELLQAPPLKRRRWLLQALDGYVRLRRDLKLAGETYRAMDCFRLVASREDLELSRANGLLQDFSPGAEESKKVCGHVVIKADLRGSTELIAGMSRSGINPATYFSRNLFGPVNTLLKTYGAEKVFVEGDAVILAILDYAGQPGAVVARACGLAHELISLVNKRNLESHRQGLPKLELGVGVAYEEGGPTYLFDEGMRITISPAIHRADRLSSSNLQRDFLAALDQEKPEGWGVEVVMFEDSANPVSKGSELRRYNVNGVELDAAAFTHLKQEVAMKTIPAEKVGGCAGDRYYLGRFPDDSGKTRWLVLREAGIRHWNGKELTTRRGSEAARFYEVVTAPELARKIRQLLTAKT